MSSVRSLPRSVQAENAAGSPVVLELPRLGAQLMSCWLLGSDPQMPGDSPVVTLSDGLVTLRCWSRDDA